MRETILVIRQTFHSTDEEHRRQLVQEQTERYIKTLLQTGEPSPTTTAVCGEGSL